MANKRKKEGSENKVFATYLELVELSDGTEIELPRLTTGKMAQISTSLAKLIDAASKKAPEGLFESWAGGGAAEKDMGMQIIKLLPQIFPLVLSEVIELMSAYLDESQEWVENLSIEDLSRIFTPFLRNTLQNMNQLLGMIGLGNVINIQDGIANDNPETLEVTAEIQEETLPIVPQEQTTQ